MYDDDRDPQEGIGDADPTERRDDAEQAEEDSAAQTDGWTVDIPRAANAAGMPRGEGDGIESDAPAQDADPDLALAPRRDEDD